MNETYLRNEFTSGGYTVFVPKVVSDGRVKEWHELAKSIFEYALYIKKWEDASLPDEVADRDIFCVNIHPEQVKTIRQAIRKAAEKIYNSYSKAMSCTAFSQSDELCNAVFRNAEEVKRLVSTLESYDYILRPYLLLSEVRYATSTIEAAAKKIEGMLCKTQEFVDDKAIENFSTSFLKEAKTCDDKSSNCLIAAMILTAIVLIGVVMVVLDYANLGLKLPQIAASQSSSPDSVSSIIYLVCNGILRAGIIALFCWLLGYFLRERRNYLHIAVANRHRSNLCKSYLVMADRLPPEIKNEYLLNLLSNIMKLGKTGFILKEGELPDGPVGEVVRYAGEALKSASGVAGK